MHHIVRDGWSMGVFIRELAALYRAFSRASRRRSPNSPSSTRTSRAGSARLQGEVARSAARPTGRSSWRTRRRPSNCRSTARARPRRPSAARASRCRSPAQVSEALRALARREGATPFMVLLAALRGAALALQRPGATSSSARPSRIATASEVEGLIGFFANTLVLRTDLSGRPDFPRAVWRVRSSALGAYAHQDLPFERLVEELHPERQAEPPSALPGDVRPAEHAAGRAAGGRSAVRAPSRSKGTAKFDLTLDDGGRGQEFAGSLEYSTDLFDADTAARMLAHFRDLFEGAAAVPDRRISALPSPAMASAGSFCGTGSDTARDYGTPRVRPPTCSRQTAATPAATAPSSARSR